MRCAAGYFASLSMTALISANFRARSSSDPLSAAVRTQCSTCAFNTSAFALARIFSVAMSCVDTSMQ